MCNESRHTCRYCKDSVSTIYSVIDQTLPVPFKGVRLCQFCHTDVSNGRYRTLRRFYTSLVYLKPLCNALIQTEYEKIKLTLTALNTELDTMVSTNGNIIFHCIYVFLLFSSNYDNYFSWLNKRVMLVWIPRHLLAQLVDIFSRMRLWITMFLKVKIAASSSLIM